jgi:malonyl-ACP O-methyltransferase BioC
VQPDKRKIRQRFARAAATYDRQAVVQQGVAERLLQLLARHMGEPPRRVLEIGCCTGILTAGLTSQYPGITDLYVNDLVPQFESLVAARVPPGVRLEFIAGDIEALPLPDSLDLVISSSTLHWLENLPGLLDRLHARMARHATLCFSIYGPGNLWELRELTGIGLDYHSLAELRQMVGQRFTVLSCEEEQITHHCPDPLALLLHLRQTGVNALATEPWSRPRLGDFIRQYERRFGDRAGVTLTYHPVYCLAHKE